MTRREPGPAHRGRARSVERARARPLRRRARRQRAGPGRCGSSSTVPTAAVDLDAITAATRGRLAAPRRRPGRRDAAARRVPPRGEQPRARAPAAPPRRTSGGRVGEVVSVKSPRRTARPVRLRGDARRPPTTTASPSTSTAHASRSTYDDITRRAPCSSGARPKPGRARSTSKQHAEVSHELRDDGSAREHRAREGHLRRDHARGARERARHRVQADAERGRGSARRDRRRDRRHPA